MANILIVEDDPTLNTAYNLILKAAGHNVQAASNGKEALDLVKDNEPEIILLDLLMPKMGGLDFLEAYNLKKHKNVKVVILSNIGNDKEVEKALELGAYKYIIKAHATPEDLSVLVNHLVSKTVETDSK